MLSNKRTHFKQYRIFQGYITAIALSTLMVCFLDNLSAQDSNPNLTLEDIYVNNAYAVKGFGPVYKIVTPTSHWKTST